LEEYDEVRFSGARLLGKEMLIIIKDSPELKKRISQILSILIEDHTPKDIDEMYDSDKTDIQFLWLKLVKELVREFDNS